MDKIAAALTGARWIACAQPGERDYAPIFRKEFTLSGPPSSAVLTICGLGIHKARLNGRPVTDEKLAPAVSHYGKRVFVSCYDVCDLLTAGQNVLAVELGRSFYAMNVPNVWDHNKAAWHDEPKLICSLYITLANGKGVRILSDPSFRSRPGAVTRCCLYTGESVDGAVEQALDGWQTAGFDDSAWPQAIPAVPPQGKLCPPEGLPIRVLAEFTPVSIQRVEHAQECIWQVAFPQNMTGWCRIRAQGKPGDTLRIRYGEKLVDGRIWLEQHFVEGELQTDTYTFGPNGRMDFTPELSYKGFQYIELIGDIAQPSAQDITAYWVAADAKDLSRFSSDAPMLDAIMDCMRRTVHNNLSSTPTDTPIFEKNGWTGDIGLVYESASYLMDLHALFDKWITDCRHSMTADGLIPLINPTTTWGFTSSPEWIDAVYEITWQIYRFTGDLSVLRRHYEDLRRNAAFALTQVDENGIPTSPLGDWIPPGYPDTCGPEGNTLTAPCFLIKSLRGLARMAQALGRPEEAKEALACAEQMKDTLNRTLFQYDQGCYKTPSTEYRQVVDIIPLAFDILPDAYREQAFARLVEDIIARDYHLNTGILGTKYLLPLLAEHGRQDIAMRIALQDTYPSWGHWIKNGVNTFLECWEMDARSYDHFMYGSVVQWIVNYVVGFRPSQDGLQNITIAPLPAGPLTRCSWQMDTRLGELRIVWQIIDGQFMLDVMIPRGMDACVVLPDGQTFPHARTGRYFTRPQ